jgi:hypothetical protein
MAISFAHPSEREYAELLDAHSAEVPLRERFGEISYISDWPSSRCLRAKYGWRTRA